ncbi:MAG TPA: hypothetical protein VF571_10045 [Pyrinomonadaceae bacterium]|jgi:hypothetical protein
MKRPLLKLLFLSLLLAGVFLVEDETKARTYCWMDRYDAVETCNQNLSTPYNTWVTNRNNCQSQAYWQCLAFQGDPTYQSCLDSYVQQCESNAWSTYSSDSFAYMDCVSNGINSCQDIPQQPSCVQWQNSAGATCNQFSEDPDAFFACYYATMPSHCVS